MRTVTVPAAVRAGQLPRRLLVLARDERLVEQIRRGNEAAFEVVFERYSGPILSFCRHMLGSREEAEDAVQHTFAAAHRSLLADEHEIRLRPWLYAIARNRCLSLLRARREEAAEEVDVQTVGLHEEVQRRADLRALLGDLRDLPAEQREALLLAELGDLPHTDIAHVLGCDVARVKALVFRARSGLIQRRDARDTACSDVREQLANLRGGSLRRGELKHHLRVCPGCREFQDEVRRQRQLMAAVLPVVPTAGLKAGVLSAIGIGGGSAGGAAGGGLAAAGGSWTLAKLAVAGVLVGGGAVAGTAALNPSDADPEGPPGAPALVPAPILSPAAASVPAAAAETAQPASAPAPGRPTTAPRRKHAGRRQHAPRREAARPQSGRTRKREAVPKPAAPNTGEAPGKVKEKTAKKPKKVKVKLAPPPPRPPKEKAPPAAAPPPPRGEEGQSNEHKDKPKHDNGD